MEHDERCAECGGPRVKEKCPWHPDRHCSTECAKKANGVEDATATGRVATTVVS